MHEIIDNANDAILAVLLGLVELFFCVFLVFTLFWVHNFEGSFGFLNNLLQIITILNSLVNLVQEVKLVCFVFNLDKSGFLGDVLDLLGLLLVGLTDLSSFFCEDFLEDCDVELSTGLDIINDSLLNFVTSIKHDLLKNTFVVLLDESKGRSLSNGVLLLNVIKALSDLFFQILDSFIFFTLSSGVTFEVELFDGEVVIIRVRVIFDCVVEFCLKSLFLFVIGLTALIVNLGTGLFDETVDIETAAGSATKAKAEFSAKLSLSFSTEANTNG